MPDSFELRLGPPLDRAVAVRTGEPITIGSDPGAGLVHAAVEPLHCWFDITTRGLEIFNASKSGTFVNGRRIERSLVRDGDGVKLGPLALRVSLRPLAGAEPAAAAPPEAPPGATGPVVLPPEVPLGPPLKVKVPSQTATTITPGTFAPKAPPPLTRRFDPAELKAAAAAAAAAKAPFREAPPAGGSGQNLGEGLKPFRMSAAEEQANRPVFHERDGSALLAAPNPTAPTELTRRRFFAPRAGEKKFEPAPAFEPVRIEPGAAPAAQAPPADPSLANETAAERLVRTELTASGLDVLSRLGGSGTVTVYRARRRDLGQEVVVKAVRLEAGDPEARAARLLAEAKVAARLHHPGIVQVHGVFTGRSFVAIVLESLHGISLHDEVAARGHLSARETIVLGEKIGRALAHAHDLGVVHRDVAPRNIMLASDGEIKLLGFGSATFADQVPPGAAAPAESAGSPGFAAPEQFADPVSVDRRADIFGLGATLHFALTGRPPGPDGPALERVPEGPAAVIRRALAAARDDRFESAEALIAALRVAARTLTETGRHTMTETMRYRLAAAAGAAAAAEAEPLGFQGRLPGREVLPLLGGAEAGRKTGWLEVRGTATDGALVAGAVYFRDGQFVRSAVRGRRSAVEALLEVAGLPLADFAVVYGPLESLGDEERAPVTPTLAAVAERLKP